MTTHERKRLKDRGRSYIHEILHKAVCVDCGYDNWLALQFDHRDPTIKEFDISSNKKKSLDALKREIAKCDIVCANCHWIRTAHAFGSWRLEALSFDI